MTAKTPKKLSLQDETPPQDESPDPRPQTPEEVSAEEQAPAEEVPAKRPTAKKAPKKPAPKKPTITWPVPPNTTSPPNEKVDGKDTTELDQGLEDLSIEQFDGAYAVLRLGKETRLVGQADLIRAQKKLAAAVQETY